MLTTNRIEDSVETLLNKTENYRSKTQKGKYPRQGFISENIEIFREKKKLAMELYKKASNHS